MEYSIRPLKKKDVQKVAELEAQCFIKPWPLNQIAYEFNGNPCAKVFVCVDKQDNILGYLDFMITFNSATIDRICVTKEYRGQGIASALLDKMVEVCKKQKDIVEFITLEVRKSNENAISLYSKNGWQKVVIKPKYYDDGEDAIYMIRSLL